MKYLISMADFVLGQKKRVDQNYKHSSPRANQANECSAFLRIIFYANLLKQFLNLWMFVPCDKEGNVLRTPPEFDDGWTDLYKKHWEKECEQYQKAKARILFEECKISDYNKSVVVNKSGNTIWLLSHTDKLIQELCWLNLELTPTAQKQIGIN